MVPRNVASISEYTWNSGCSLLAPSPAPGEAQPSLWEGAPATTGTGDPASSTSSVPAPSTCSPGASSILPATGMSSTSPVATTGSGSATWTTTSIVMSTVVVSVTVGGTGSSTPRWS